VTGPPGANYGSVPREAWAQMTGREILEAIIDGRLPRPPISKTLGIWLAEVREGFAAFEGEPTEQVLNPMGVVHGGWALTLIDSAAGCAAQTLLPAGVGYTTIETKANFSRAITPQSGRVRAESRVVTVGRQIISAEAWVKASDGRILAHGTSTLLVRNPAARGE